MKIPFVLLILAGPAFAGPLDDFKQLPSKSEKEFYSAAEKVCRQMIAARTGTARVRVYGPCEKNDGKWSGVARSGNNIVLTFTVHPDDDSSQHGALWNAMKGTSVIVACSADAGGKVISMKDEKIGITSASKNLDLCAPI